jgi:FKBP-type peptidyl-prolyl cis-trans isomerase FkpA
MKQTFYCTALSLCLLAMSCSEKKTPGGLKYKLIRKGDGKEVAFGQILVMNLQLKDSKDSVWFSTITNGYPVMMPAPDASMEKDGGEYGVFKILTKGDSISFQVTAQNFFTKTRRRPVPQDMDSLSLITFNVGLKDAWTQKQAEEFQQKMMLESQQAQVKKDSVAMNNFLNEKGIVAISAASGIRYVVKKEGKGQLAVAGQTALVHYAGYTLDGKLFDTSIASVAKENNFDNQGRNEPYPVVVSTGNVITGWHQMLALMNKGMKVTVYIPSYLAYGQSGRGPGIPPNTILIFDMEVTDLK